VIDQRKMDTYLCAYIVPAAGEPSSSDASPRDGASTPCDGAPTPCDGGPKIEAEQLETYLAQYLPAYMIPSYFLQLENIPLTPNGKIDRKALPEPDFHSGSSYIEPRNTMEKQLAAIWSRVLNGTADSRVEPGIDDDFFRLGGHSLKAALMVSEIHKTFNVEVPLTAIFRTPTIRGLAGFLAKAA
ncbi:MAG: hypothetical protein GY765_39180, partial [bacterium]|nr:hypothetical protein [bacterium]